MNKGMPVFGRIHSIETFGAVDGPGIRYIVFLQGCPLRCVFCHNPDTWDISSGREIDSLSLINDICKYRNFLKNGGITLSGGEPLLQKDFSLSILRLAHAEGLHTAIDTAGSLPLEQIKELVDEADLIILDIKALDSELCCKITGQDNKNALRLLNYCEEKSKPLWIRHVLVPNLTLKDKELMQLAVFLKKYTAIQRVDLLPFHQFGRYKWQELNICYPLKECIEPTVDEVNRAKKLFFSFFC